MEPKDLNFAAIPQTAVNVVTKPAEFFQEMPKAGGYLEPLVFAVAMGLISGVIYAVLGLFGLGQAGHGGIGAALSMIILMPIGTAIGSFIGGAILFVIWKLMGSPEDYEASYRCGAYLMALYPITAILNAIPYAGAVISAAIMLFYLVMASIHVHNLESQKAWLVFGVIAVIMAILSVYGEYTTRHLSPEAEKWRQMQKEYSESAEEMQKSADELRKQAEEMARKYREQQSE